jgi:hypothetical protein
MPTSRLLAYQQLKAAGACADQRALFKAKFGLQVEVTVALATQVAQEFDWLWAAKLLSAAALAAYEHQRAAALNELTCQYTLARAEFTRQCAGAQAENARQCELALAECERQRAAVWAEYNRQHAATWAQAYINDCA